jgi:hypothetical protein
MKTFWLMSGNIDRIMAQRDMRTLTVFNAAQGQESATQCRDHLVIEAGTIVKTTQPAAMRDEKMDEAGLSELKALAGQLG